MPSLGEMVPVTMAQALQRKRMEIQDASVMVKELLPIILACAVWGPIWCCSSMMIHCDNATAITVINLGVLKIMHGLRCLFFIRARFQMSLHTVHTLGHLNSVADAISQNNLPHLFKQVPAASHTPDRILPELLDLQQPEKDLDKTVQQLFSAGLAQSTHRSYQFGSHQNLQFCHVYNIVALFPVTEKQLMQFVAFLFTKGLSGGTVSSSLLHSNFIESG